MRQARKKNLRQSSICLLTAFALNASAQSAPPAAGASMPARQPANDSVQPAPQDGAASLPASQPEVYLAPMYGSNNNSREIPAWKFQHLSPENTWTRHFRLGMLVGFNIKADFTMSGTFNTATAPGTYDDGYVLTDSRGAAGDSAVGTGNFGLGPGSQISGNQIILHQTTDFTVGNGNSSGDDSPYLGLDLAYGDSYWIWEHAKVGWEFGFGFLPIHVVGNATVTANQTAYTFDNAGLIDFSLLPSDYQGGYDVHGDQGIAVGLNPSSTSGPAAIAGTTSEKLDVMLYTFRLGPTLYWDLTRRIGLYAGAGPAVGIVSGDLKGSGIVNLSDGTIAHYNAASESGTSLVYGGYVNATLVYHAVPGGDFYLGAQFMPMNGATIGGSHGSGHLDLGGQVYVTAGINWPF